MGAALYAMLTVVRHPSAARHSSPARFALRASALLFLAIAAIAAPAAHGKTIRMPTHRVPTYTPVVINSPAPVADGLFQVSGPTTADIDGDGVQDVLVSQTNHVWVISGRTRRVLLSLTDPDPQPNADFGGEAFFIGDVNHDGVSDIYVGADGQNVGANAGQGEGFVFSGKTGKLLYSVQDPLGQAGAGFGGDGTPTHILNGGVPEFIQTAPGEDAAGVAGATYAFSGQDGHMLYQLANPFAPPFQVGGSQSYSVSDQGHVTRSNVDDLVLGEFGVSGGGTAYLLDGANGQVIRALTDPFSQPAPGFGSMRAQDPGAPGDVNLDGVPDIYVDGQNQDVGGLTNIGEAFVLNGRTDKLISTLKSPFPQRFGFFGYDMARAGDLTGDGTNDLLVSQTGCCASFSRMALGGAWVFNPRTGRMMVSFERGGGKGAGQGIANAGDVNGDGYPDYFLGQPRSGPKFDGHVILELSHGPRLHPRLTDRVRPLRHGKAPHTFTVAGRLLTAPGLIRPCRAGSVSVSATAGPSRLRAARSRLRGNCTYRVAIHISAGVASGTLVRLTVAFSGNRILFPSAGTTRLVTIGG